VALHPLGGTRYSKKLFLFLCNLICLMSDQINVTAKCKNQHINFLATNPEQRNFAGSDQVSQPFKELCLKELRNLLPSFMSILSNTLPNLSITDEPFQPVLVSTLIRSRFQVKHATLLIPVDLFLLYWWRSFTVHGIKVTLFLNRRGEWFFIASGGACVGAAVMLVGVHQPCSE